MKAFGDNIGGSYLWLRGYWESMLGLGEEKKRKYVQWQERQDKQNEVAR
jgi:hypothetical protein